MTVQQKAVDLDRYFEPDGGDDAGDIDAFFRGALTGLFLNREHEIPDYVIVAGTMKALAHYLAQTVPQAAPEEVWQGLVATFQRMVGHARLVHMMQIKAGREQ
jgi:hypothetical protein